MTDQHSPASKYLSLALGATLMTFAGASARTGGFDGNWSVVIITEGGSCDAAYRYAVSVDNGTVHYRGEAGINVSGSVDDAGRVRVTIGRGSQRAEGSGRLTAASGTGTWSGSSSTDRCHGRWEAERR